MLSVVNPHFPDVTSDLTLENFSLEGYSLRVPSTATLPEKPLPLNKVKLK